MLKTLRDRGIRHMLNANQSVSRVAQVLEVSLKSGSAKVRVLLNGEAEPVDISFNYAFEGKTVSVTGVKTNREWLNGLAELFKDKYSSIDISKYGAFAQIAGYFL
ncbi:MAG: hypothetical protein FWC23_05205 [Chitinispirillia bacterium]|nr:hypothetical protein [Chitinispirillia bacterium]MCL2268566.1 hypothetical protein [Chitinispirillia bacterium]